MDEKTRRALREEYENKVERRLTEVLNRAAKTFEERLTTEDIEWLAKYKIRIDG